MCDGGREGGRETKIDMDLVLGDELHIASASNCGLLSDQEERGEERIEEEREEERGEEERRGLNILNHSD